MKDYIAVMRVDDKIEHLSVSAKNKEEAKKLALDCYDGYIHAKIISDYKYITIYER